MNAPQLTRLQLAWLQEIGIDRRMLSHYAVQDAETAVAFPVGAMVAKAGAPLAADDRSPQLEGGSSSLRGESAAPATATTPSDAVSRHPAAPVNAIGPPSGKARSPTPIAPAPYVRPALASNWEGLQSQVEECRGCSLHSARGRTVFGSGAVEAPQLMVIGEAPGGSDDRAGQPFQGKAGTLLKAMLAAAGLDGDTACYTNLLKCRPLGNRPPTPEEAEACMPFLQRQIALTKPRQILAMGSWAAQALLGVQQDIDALRGRSHVIQSEAGEAITLVVTYHPAALLLRPQHKADAWRDLLLLRSIMIEPD